MKQDFGAVIRTRRNALGMNQARLAEETGVSRNAVAGWETGHSRPDLGTVPALCKALEIPIEAFFGVETPRTEEGRRLLRFFDMLDQRDREAVLWQTEALAEGRKRQAAASVPPGGRKPGRDLPTSRQSWMPPPCSLNRERRSWTDAGASSRRGTPWSWD